MRRIADFLAKLTASVKQKAREVTGPAPDEAERLVTQIVLALLTSENWDAQAWDGRYAKHLRLLGANKDPVFAVAHRYNRIDLTVYQPARNHTEFTVLAPKCVGQIKAAMIPVREAWLSRKRIAAANRIRLLAPDAAEPLLHGEPRPVDLAEQTRLVESLRAAFAHTPPEPACSTG